jgi:hypothetical protein
MSPKQWGRPVWHLFHVLAEKIKEEKYPILFRELFSNIYQISSILPCNDCATHAKHFLSKIKVENLKTKKDFQNMLYVFHNSVNSRIKNPPFKYENLEEYKSMNIISTFNEFSKNFHTNGNMNLITENFHRKQFLINFRKWLMQNIPNFDL